MKNREIIEALLKVKNLLNKAGEKEVFSKFNLTVANYELLKIIQEEKIDTVSGLQEYLTDSLPSLTQKTQKLIKLKYLNKRKDKNDPRKNLLQITDTGKKVIKKIERKIEIVATLMFRKYSKKEKEIFVEILKHLEKKLSKKIKNEK